MRSRRAGRVAHRVYVAMQVCAVLAVLAGVWAVVPTTLAFKLAFTFWIVGMVAGLSAAGTI